VVLPRDGRWRVWIGGGVTGRLTITVDGRQIATTDNRVNRAREYESVATVPLGAGRHRVSIRYDEELLGDSSKDHVFGPLAFTQAGAPAEPIYLSARDVDLLCGHRLDWIEAIPTASRPADDGNRASRQLGST
jgi:hypothetical protein